MTKLKNTNQNPQFQKTNVRRLCLFKNFLKNLLMINYSDLKDDTIENTIISLMKNSPKFQMDTDLGGILISLLVGGKNFSIPHKKKPFLTQVIEKRISASHTFSTSDFRLILFLASVSETPGCAILYLWYIQYWCYSNKIKEIDLDIFCNRIFPNGFLSQKNLQKIWDNQKVINAPKFSSDNLVDYNFCGNSIHILTVPTA